MQIREIDTTRAQDVRQFIGFPFRLYRDNKQWVPPILPEMHLLLNRSKHPFYEHSDAVFFVAENSRETLGRIVVMDNHNYNRHHGRKVAFFYHFDVVEDRAAALALFDAACGWAHGRGLDTLVGPKGFLQGDGIGMLCEGFDYRPAMGIAYNHAYYNDFALEAGFQKETDFLSGHLPPGYQLPQRFYDIAEQVKARRGLWIKSFSSDKELRQWAPRIGRVYNQTFVDNWEYCPITDAELKATTERLISIAHPRLIKLVMRGDDIVGFVFAFPDVSAAIQRTRGRVWPLGWIDLLWEFKHTDCVNFNGTGLLPGHRGVGANAVLYTELGKSAQAFQFKHSEVVQIEEGNSKSLGDMQAIGVRWHKRHRIYRRAC